MTTLIIGAGLVGMTTAQALHAAGEDVLVIERCPAPGSETSRANGSLLHPSLVEPWNSPGILKVLFRNLGREDAAVLLRLKALPALVGWGIGFLRNSSPQRHLANALRNVRLAQHSIECMRVVREQTGVEYAYYQRGSLALYRESPTFEAALRWYDELGRHGLGTDVLEPQQVVAMDPALAPVADRLVGATFAPGDESGDPFAFCAGLHGFLAEQGVRFYFEQSVTAFLREGDRVGGVRLEGGEEVRADRVVLAAGSYSTPLAALLGIRLPVRPVKGYSLTLPRGDSGTAPNVPASDSFLHLAVVPVGEDRIRVAGTAEFTGFDRRITPTRVTNLQRLLGQLYPDYVAALNGVDPNGWTGLRPMCPDGVPLIGASAIDGLYLNTGHGHAGWTLAAGSARVLADVMLGRPPAVPAADYAPVRLA
ncbi:MAG: D-amino acid dehydrogenase [Pseudomonadota bacterium]